MSAVPGWAHDEARLVALGMVCCQCREPFTRAHGEVVACGFCHRRMSGDERAAIPRATHPEATGEAFAERHRKRKREAEGILAPEGLQVYNTRRKDNGVGEA